MNKTKYRIVVIFGIIFSIVVFLSVFIVKETEQVIITQFGKPVGKPILHPGIHLKIPLIQKANLFDRRFLEWDGNPNQIPTKDKRLSGYTRPMTS